MRIRKECFSCFCPAENHEADGCSTCRCSVAATLTSSVEKLRDCRDCPHYEEGKTVDQRIPVTILNHLTSKASVWLISPGTTLGHCSKGYWEGWVISESNQLGPGPGRPKKSLLTDQANECADYELAEKTTPCLFCDGKATQSRGDFDMCWSHTKIWDEKARELRMSSQRPLRGQDVFWAVRRETALV
jgi:hypothetical protein